MVHIINTSTIQKNIGVLEKLVTNSWSIVINRGKPKAILLPYFDGHDESVDRYMEDYEMSKNASVLQEHLSCSRKSGLSKLRI